MKRIGFTAFGAGLSGLMLLAATPALAEGKADRARAAIAEAKAKVDTANKLGVSGDLPRMQAQAQAALRSAQEALASGHKEDAIADAHHASELADTAIGESQKHRADSDRAQRSDAEAAAATAQQDAAAANARAASAEQAAASAAADAQAARDATPAVVVAAPAPAPTTTLTTQTIKSSTATTKAPVKRKVVHHTTAAGTVTEKTTATVTTNQ